jgi:hypothetical protein
MRYLKEHWVPLAVGVAVGWYLGQHGGVKAQVAKVKSTVNS